MYKYYEWADKQQTLQKYRILRIEYLLYLIFVNVACLVLEMCNVYIPEGVCIILFLVHMILYGAKSFEIHQTPFLKDIIERLEDMESFCLSDEFYKYIYGTKYLCVPLRNNFYIYTKEKGDFVPYQVKVTNTQKGLDIDLNRIGNCKLRVISMEGKEVFSFEETTQSLSNTFVIALQLFEQSTNKIYTITNEYGDIVWSKGNNKKISNMHKKYIKTKILLFNLLFFVAYITPLIYLVYNLLMQESLGNDIDIL